MKNTSRDQLLQKTYSIQEIVDNTFIVMFILALRSVVLKLGGGGGECSVLNEARNDRGRTLIMNARIKFEVKNKCNLLYSVLYL